MSAVDILVPLKSYRSWLNALVTHDRDLPTDHPHVRFERVWAMPRVATFTMPPIHELLGRYIRRHDRVVDPFARNSRWGTCTNDLNPHTKAHNHLDAIDFLMKLPPNHFDRALFDPPYSARQVKQCYQGFGRTVTQADTQLGVYTRIKDEFARILRPDALVICCGWNSGGMGIGRSYTLIEVMLIPHGGIRNDTS